MLRVKLRHLVLIASLLAACSTLGSASITYSRGDIAKQAFVDRRSGGFGELLKGVEGAGVSGPDVGFATAARRIELAWTATLARGPLGVPVSVSVAISGTPELNANMDGIDLADARVESVRVPFIALGGESLKKDQSLGRLPLLAFDPGDLNRNGILYKPESLSLGAFGLRVRLVPK